MMLRVSTNPLEAFAKKATQEIHSSGRETWGSEKGLIISKLKQYQNKIQ